MAEIRGAYPYLPAPPSPPHWWNRYHRPPGGILSIGSYVLLVSILLELLRPLPLPPAFRCALTGFLEVTTGCSTAALLGGRTRRAARRLLPRLRGLLGLPSGSFPREAIRHPHQRIFPGTSAWRFSLHGFSFPFSSGYPGTHCRCGTDLRLFRLAARRQFTQPPAGGFLHDGNDGTAFHKNRTDAPYAAGAKDGKYRLRNSLIWTIINATASGRGSAMPSLFRSSRLQLFSPKIEPSCRYCEYGHPDKRWRGDSLCPLRCCSPRIFL